MIKHFLFISILSGGVYFFWTTKPVTHGPGIVAPITPVQKKAYGIKSLQFKKYTVTALANFNIEARVLAKKEYDDDSMSAIAPYDFVVSWGPMSDEKNLEKILFRQYDRSFTWEMTGSPIPQEQMRKHSANIHLIPHNKEIRERLEATRIGEIINIQGYLVKVKSHDGVQWNSSLSRTDHGKNASELLWIETLEIL